MTAALATAQPPKASILAKMAERFSVEPNKLLDTLKATAFKGQVSNEQMISLLIVADQYGLNPFTRELFAFPDKGGIVPVVSVDGWARIINGHPQFDGIQFDYAGDGTSLSCTATVFRKDRNHPVSVTEYLAECKRDTQPWKSHPRRMLRHKAMIQCARLAFGFAGVFDEEEAHTIRDMGAADEVRPSSGSLQAVRAAVAAKAQTTTVDMETGAISDGPALDGEASLLPAYLAKLEEATSAEGAALLLDEARDTLSPAEHKTLADAYGAKFQN